MSDAMFPCKACGHTVENPDPTRFTLSIERPAVCPACGAPHVYEASVTLDQRWLRQQLGELADLRDRSRHKGVGTAAAGNDDSGQLAGPADGSGEGQQRFAR